MPLEMVDDPQEDQGKEEITPSNSGQGRSNPGGGGGGGIITLLPVLFSLFRGGKGMIWILLLVVAGYFVFKSGSCSGISNVVSAFTTGGKLDPAEFQKASVYEGLEDDNTKNPLPEMVSLVRFAPAVQNQGSQGSCVAWSSGYAARTIIESASTAQDPNSIAFSPAFLYNQIGLDGCQGSYIIKAMEFMTQKGIVPLADFPYDASDCSRQPNNQLWNFAAQNRMHGFNRLTEDDGVTKLSLRAIKEHLSKDAPVVIGMMVGGSFMQDMMGQKVWHPTADDYDQVGFGGHAMCVIGYDDRVEGGAFQIMNSWGPEWGENGFAYVRYKDFPVFVREAYGVDPMPKRGAALSADFECEINLVNNDSKEYIPLELYNGNTFKTVSPLKKGSRFKIEIKNTVECYIYLFTPDATGKSFVLFPYKPIHSPYCGITGVRLFPKSQSVRADEIGSMDFMGVVVSKKALDYAALNDAINQSTEQSFRSKLNDVISSNMIRNVRFSKTDSEGIYFKASVQEQNDIVGCVVEIEKN